MSIRHWPSEERPREKLLARGAGALSDIELLAIFLRVGVQGKSAVALAQELLETLGGLPGLFGAQVEAFRRIRGVGDAKFVQVRAVLELARRYLDAEIRRPEALSDPAAVRRYLEAQLRGSAREIFWGLFLDTQNRVLASMALFTGTLDQASVHPREVVRAALVHNASSVIVAHNHPSGARQASVADRALTERLKAALGLVEVRLLDHFIIADGPPISFAEQGWL